MGVLAFPISRACETEIQVNSDNAVRDVEVRPMIARLEHGWKGERRVQEKKCSYMYPHAFMRLSRIL
jgi:hypothetical protein